MGVYYERGFGSISVNWEEAEYWYRHAIHCKKEDMAASYLAPANFYLYTGREKETVEYYEKCIDYGLFNTEEKLEVLFTLGRIKTGLWDVYVPDDVDIGAGVSMIRDAVSSQKSRLPKKHPSSHN